MARLSRRREGGPSTSPRLVIILLVVCIALLLLDLSGLRYGYLAYEKAFGGWALTALAAGLFVLALAALLRPLLSRRGDLYGDDDD